jgi:hypothetical protein
MGVSIREKRGRLYLDIYKNGHRSWESLHLTLTSDKAQNKEIRKMAEICRAKKEMQLVSGEWNIQDIGAGRVSVAEYAMKVAAMPGHCYNVKTCARKLKAYKGADTRIGAVSAQWVKNFQDHLKTGAGLSISSVAAYMKALRTIFNQAVKDNIILKSPASGIAGLDVPEKEIVFLTVAELRALFDHAGNPAWRETARLTKNLTWHIARKKFATQSLEGGAEIYTVAKLLGQKGLKQVARYAEATDKLKRAAVGRLPDLSVHSGEK